jgi:aspartate aminotransferase-like enzyme
MNRILVSPGPVHVPASLSEGLPPLHHRSGEFRLVVRETESMMRELLHTEAPVYLLTASGTGAMEAAIANVVDEGSRVLVLSGGKFGDRWAELCRAFGCRTECLRIPDGRAIDVAAVCARVDRSRPDFLVLTHVESSTGLLLPLRALAGALSSERPMVVLDAVSSLCVEDLEMDAWGIDVVVGACQKAFAAPPGASFVSMGTRARELMKRRRPRLYYLDLNRYEPGRESGDLPFTPAVRPLQILHRSLARMREIGIEKVKERHRTISSAFLAAACHFSLDSFAQQPSSSVQVLRLDASCDGEEVLDALAARGFVAAGGQGGLRGRVLRTGFLGLFGSATMLSFVSALGAVLADRGVAVDVPSAEREIRGMRFSEDLF